MKQVIVTILLVISVFDFAHTQKAPEIAPGSNTRATKLERLTKCLGSLSKEELVKYIYYNELGGKEYSKTYIRYLKLIVQRDTLAEGYPEKHPRMKEAERQIAQEHKMLELQADTILRAFLVNAEIAAIQSNEK